MNLESVLIATLTIGTVSLVFKWLLGQIGGHIDRLSANWESSSNRLIHSVEALTEKLTVLTTRLDGHIHDDNIAFKDLNSSIRRLSK